MTQLISRFQHWLWDILPKHIETVEGHRIKYVIVLKYLLIGGPGAKSRFVNAMCLIHKPTKNLMILISSTESQDPLLKYTLLHEHLEGMALLNFPLPGYDLDWARSTLDVALKKIRKDVIDIEERMISAIKRKKGNDRGHFFALTVELALMKKELDSKQYRQKLEHALRKRF